MCYFVFLFSAKSFCVPFLWHLQSFIKQNHSYKIKNVNAVTPCLGVDSNYNVVNKTPLLLPYVRLILCHKICMPLTWWRVICLRLIIMSNLGSSITISHILNIHLTSFYHVIHFGTLEKRCNVPSWMIQP